MLYLSFGLADRGGLSAAAETVAAEAGALVTGADAARCGVGALGLAEADFSGLSAVL